MDRAPVVMSISGHDPTGGAGIQADIEAINAFGCHAVTVITCLTEQDTVNVHSLRPLNADYILQQARTLFADIQIDAVKIGLLGNCEIVEAICELLSDYPHIPVVLDPVLVAGGGTSLAKDNLIVCIQDKLLPKVTLVTPNVPEADALSIFDVACENVLLTGTHNESTKDVVNTLYHQKQITSELSWPRLPETYHGSGCTLASSVAAGLAKGLLLEKAVEEGQKYTWNTLAKARKIGKGQLIPKRF